MAVDFTELHPKVDGTGEARPLPVAAVLAMPVSAARSFDLGHFDLSDMIECGRAVREVADRASSMEDAAVRIVSLLHRSLVSGGTGGRNCALIRCFKTHRFGQLPQELETWARGLLGTDCVVDPQMPCLTLLATAGERPEWNDRRESRGHQAIPLESVAIVERAPMIAALLRQMGLGIESAMYPDEQIILDAEQHAFNVFHVEEADGAASIPGHDQFVRARGIRSVLGFGGLLSSGDLFAVIIFSRVRIPRETADLFRTIALGVKLALLPFTHGPIFASEERMAGETVRSDRRSGFEDEQIRSETATLRLLIPALEEAALQQTERLKLALSDLRMQSEQTRQQQVRLSAMLEATTDAVVLLDREWRFTFLNRQAQVLFANGRDLLGENIWTLFPEVETTEFGTQYRRVMHEGLSVQFQEYYPEPLDKWFEVHAFPSEDGMAAFFQDITGRLNREAQLRQTEKLAATGRMAASIAHEINNPLESVTNLLYLIGSDAKMAPESQNYLRLAESELQRVSEITTHMLRFHRQSTKRAEVNLAEVLDSVLILFQGRMGQAGVGVSRRWWPARALQGFAGELRQIFANLVGNAMDACTSGGAIVLRVREAREGRGVRITVADSGCGMSAETRKKLFEPFYTTKGIIGTGLGLWVSLELIQKHNGTVKVRSSQAARRHGTVFAVYFPFQAS